MEISGMSIYKTLREKLNVVLGTSYLMCGRARSRNQAGETPVLEGRPSTG